MREVINKVINGDNLTLEESISVMSDIMEGKATPAQIASYITALRIKGETIEEITGAAMVMREKAAGIPVASRGLIDVCGTGGDSLNTFNISTVTAFVLAGAGLLVAKHGNRSVSSTCGSADLLEKLGVNINLEPRQVGRCIDEIGIGFLFAPVFHQAMKYAVKPRREIGIRTIFNVLGPLTNPAGAKLQLLGVYDPDLTEPVAYVLKNLGVKAALVVHGVGGMDEITTTGKTRVSQLADGKVQTYYLDPLELGLETAAIEELAGGSPDENARIARDILHGHQDKKRDIVLLNSAAALVIAEKVDNFKDALNLAAKAIDSGAALKKLNQLQELSAQLAGVAI
ncbi:MAG: anthranilate phosphoribosyltransferase [Firmicutes bacterium]|nr:anthranilate phosphoribosyltransferase [Bacillota bacterium]